MTEQKERELLEVVVKMQGRCGGALSKQWGSIGKGFSVVAPWAKVEDNLEKAKDWLKNHPEKPWEPEYGEMVLVWANKEEEETARERIYLTTIKNTYSPFFCVDRGYEDRFRNGLRFSTNKWDNIKPLPRNTGLLTLVKENVKAIKVLEENGEKLEKWFKEGE